MSYGLYISDGKNGAVITNSNNIFNEEVDLDLSDLSLPSGGSLPIQTEGAGNPALIELSIVASGETIDDLTITRDLSTDTLTITNTGTSDLSFSAKLFRFQ
jgi:uncharacterized protein (UPF0303 family)